MKQRTNNLWFHVFLILNFEYNCAKTVIDLVYPHWTKIAHFAPLWGMKLSGVELSFNLETVFCWGDRDGPPLSCCPPCRFELVDNPPVGGAGSVGGGGHAEGPIFGNSVRTGDRVLPFCNKQVIRSNVMCRFFPCTYIVYHRQFRVLSS